MPWKQSPRKAVTPKAKASARKSRRSPTDAERQLWLHLRGDFAGQGTHFRRQQAIGPYVVDFCCLKHRVVVEVDGPIHLASHARAHDAVRDAYLMANGFRVVRASNRDVVSDLNSVLGRISLALAAPTPTPYPSPQGGGDSRKQGKA